MTERALLVSRNFAPLIGGMERLNEHLLTELSSAYEMYLVGPDGAEKYASSPERVMTCPSRPLYAFLLCAMMKAVYGALRCKPRFILAGSGANALPAWLAARISGAKWGVFLHGLDLVVDNAVYRYLILPLIKRADFWFANSRATADIAVRMGLDAARLRVVNPGVTLPEQLPDPARIEQWRRRIGAEHRPIILSVGRLTRRKGLREFIAEAFPSILCNYPEALLVIVGAAPANALAAESVGVEALQDAAQRVGVHDSIRILGTIDDAQLALAFSASAVHVFPVLDIPGDMEGFGMVAIEAAAHGLPTVAFGVGGVPDAVAHDVSGALVKPGDYNQFAERVVDVLAGKVAGNRQQCRAFAARFSWGVFGGAVREHVARQLAPTADRT